VSDRVQPDPWPCVGFSEWHINVLDILRIVLLFLSVSDILRIVSRLLTASDMCRI
jgi:hypothetical protein